MLCQFSDLELREAARAITSVLSKSEKAIHKLKDDSAQYRLTADGIRAYQIAFALIAQALGDEPAPAFAKEECMQASATLSALSARVEKALPKFAAGTPQHTLAARRIRAFEIAVALIEACRSNRTNR